MSKRIGWLVFSWFALLAGSVQAQPAPQPEPKCDEAWFRKTAGKTSLSHADLKAICDERNTDAFNKAVSICGPKKDSCIKARTDTCNSATSATFELLAQCYRAAGDPELVRDPASTPTPDPPVDAPAADAAAPKSAAAQAEGAAAAGAVSIIAQGLGDFLVQRAEQEVSLYAATELQKALCERYGEVYFPKSCKLLKESDEDGDPVGLGVLRRAVVEDLRELPASVLVSVMDRLGPEHKEKACVLDVGYAFAKGVLKEGTVAPLLEPNEKDGGHLRLHRYSIWFEKPVAERRCESIWNALKSGLEKLKQARLLYENGRQLAQGLPRAVERARKKASDSGSPLGDEQAKLLEQWAELVEALHAVLTGPAPKEASARAVRAGVALLKALLPKEDAAVFDEAGAISIATIEGDWIGIVGAVASAEHLGPVLLCKKDATTCVTDTKARATLRLLGDVATADTSEGVTAALERFAAPLGSWRRKYQGGWYLMANGYVGAKGAYEHVKDARPGWTMAPVLAVGLELGRNAGDLARLGVFLQVLDLGNVSSIRLSEENDPNLAHVEVAPDVTAAQLFAPGVFVNIALWKAPFALNLGFDVVPELRTVAGEQEPAWHVGIGAVVDTPILEIVHE